MNDHHIISGDARIPANALLNQQSSAESSPIHDNQRLSEPLALCSAYALQVGLEGASPVSNTGVKSHWIDLNTVKDDPSWPSVNVDTLTMTFCGLRFSWDYLIVDNWLRKWSAGLLSVGGLLQKHYNGYDRCFDIILSDGTKSPSLGWLGVPQQGDHMRGRWCLHLTGQGCAVLALAYRKMPGCTLISYEDSIDSYGSKIQRAVSRSVEGETISAWEMLVRDSEAYGLRLTRVDLAADDLDGVQSVSVARELYANGAFSLNGRPPKSRLILNSDNDGDTFYVGRACSGKMLRVYEKGKQLGCPESQWVRWEVQISAVNRTIPLAVLTDPRSYLCGSYPDALSWVGNAATIIETKVERAQITLQAALKFARRQVGALVRYLKDCKLQDDDVIVSELIGGKGRYPMRLFDYKLPDDPWLAGGVA